MRSRTSLILMIVLVLSLTIVPAGRAARQLQARSVITYPTDGMTVSGAVDIVGIATHPNMNFYQLRFAAGPEPTGDSQWIDFAIVEGVQVDNDVLGTWDTTVIPDGQYTLALAVWGVNDASSPYVFFVRHITVNNTQPVPSPTPEQPTPVPLPTAVPATPTPVQVEQPPTPTPRLTPTATATPAEGEPTPTGDAEKPKFSVDMAQLRSAFCAGGLVSLSFFALIGLYMLVKAIVRWVLRHYIRPFPR
ncbi:MAG TPA: hypothetical protein ENK17_03345 [Anaerolineae bacterium]|nr:hypothetical protein [Anaerolineae bacterium]